MENLVLSGGGVYGICEIGKLKFLEDQGLDISKIKKFAGCSIGALMATLISIGYSVDQLYKIILGTNFSAFKLSNFYNDAKKLQAIKGVDTMIDSKGQINMTFLSAVQHFLGKNKIGKFDKLFKNAKNFYNLGGAYDCKDFLDWVEKVVEKKIEKKKIKFLELYQKTNKELNIVATNMNTHELAIFNHKTSPDLIVSQAVLISMSVPFLVCPRIYKNDVYLDGGIKCNFPIDIFKDEREKTVGIELIEGKKERMEIKNVIDLSKSVINLLISSRFPDFDRNNYTIYQIDINQGPDINLLDFNLTNDQKAELYNFGFR